VLFSAMGGEDGLEATETDWARRRPKTEFWLELQNYVNVLSGRAAAGKPLWSCYECKQPQATIVYKSHTDCYSH
jgi:6-phosphofructokinase 1